MKAYRVVSETLPGAFVGKALFTFRSTQAVAGVYSISLLLSLTAPWP